MARQPSARTSREASQQNRYRTLIDKIFFDRYALGAKEIDFKRNDIKEAARSLDVELPDNLGDVIYAFRFQDFVFG